MKVIIISGTPAAGKKTLAQWLGREFNFKILNLKPLIKKLSEKFDILKQCYVVDTRKLNRAVINLIKEEKNKETAGVIIPSHLSHHLPKGQVDLCIVVKCSDLKKLEQRLKKRKYSRKKIMENLQCEIFDICLEQAKKKKHRIISIDTTKQINRKNLVKGIMKLI